MKNPVYAPAVKAPYHFGERSRWIHAENVANFSVQFFRRSFELAKRPQKAVLLAMASNYAEIYINGRAAASLAVRSYVFDKTYEVYDVTEYLCEGKNVIAVQNIDTGEAVRAGFALELQADGETICVSDESFVYAIDDSLESGVFYYIIGGGEERVHADKWMADFADVNLDDSAWPHALVIGDSLYVGPLKHLNQSITEGQTADVYYAENFAAILRSEPSPGLCIRLQSAGSGVTLSMTKLTVESDTKMMFVAPSGVRTVAIDGKNIPLHQNVNVPAGEHFVMFAHGGNPELLIRTEGEPFFSSYIGDEKPVSAYVVEAPKLIYPWNQFRGRGAHDDTLDSLLEVASFDALPVDVKEALVAVDFGMVGSLAFADHARDRSVPKNGFAPERLYLDPRIKDTDKTVLFENYESLLHENASAVIPAQEGEVCFILDFGMERVGKLAFALNAPAGTEMDLMFFETFTDDGIAPMNGNNFARYFCKEGEQEYILRRLHGFRYLSVTVRDNISPVTIRDIHLIEMRYPTEKTEFICSDEKLNRVYEMSTRTAEVCMLDMYCDCPGFEQNPWTGDARCTARVNLHSFGAFDFDEQYLKRIALSIDDGLWYNYRRRNQKYIDKLNLPCACFPTFPEGCIPVWSMMWLLQVWDHYMVTGDKNCLADLFPAVKETLHRCTRMTDERGLFDMQGAWNLIEWANNDLDFYGEVTANNVMLSYCFRKAADMAEELGDDALAADYRVKADGYRDSVNKYCWDEEKRAYVDTARDEFAYARYVEYMKSREMPVMPLEEYMACGRIGVQSNTMALLYDCVPEDRHEDAIRFLIDNITSGLYINGTPARRTHGAPSEEEAPDGYVHIGSPFFMYFALSALYKFGHHDLALMAQRRDWGIMAELGYTTCYETFKTGREWPRSAAHAWSASPAIFLKTEVLGIKPTKPGYAEFTIAPKISELTFAKGAVPTPKGYITVEWHKREDGTLDIRCEAPEGCVWVR